MSLARAATSAVAQSGAAEATTSRSATRAATWTLANIARDGRVRWPKRLAAVDGDVRLTFQELYEQSRGVALLLQSRGASVNARIAVGGGSPVASIIAILGIAMAGATYVPIDTTQPLARLRFLLSDAEVQGIIGDANLRRVVTDLGPRLILDISELTRLAKDCASDCARALATPSATAQAYLMYTSGSSGQPKGVQIEHHSLRAFFDAHNERARIAEGDRCLNTGPFHFDVSLMDVFLPLYVGATVYFSGRLPIPTVVLRAIERHRITHLYAVGTVLALITGDGHRLDEYDLSSLSTLQTGAEVCNVRVVNEWLKRLPLRFINSYGPTEATVGCISFLKPESGPLLESDCPIGTPHTGTRIELLDADGEFVTRPGLEGEIVIAGPQLMSSYWRRPTENERVFIVIEGERFYRTGDYAIRDARGQYRIVGRRDDEVKFNGHRIHLNEVSTCLCTHACTESALAGVLEVEPSQPEIVAILATTAIPTLELARELDTHVSNRLPAVMRPTRWAFMHALPRLPSGKADREECLRRLALAIRASDARYYVQVETALSPLPRAA